jgi:hypothetical protein
MPVQKRGKESAYYKGPDATYSGFHKRVVRTRGSAVECSRRAEAGCTSQWYEWAQIHGTDPGDPQSYVQMCKSCHVSYDATRGEDKPQAKLTWVQVREIRDLYANGGITYRELGERYGVVLATIAHVVKRRTYLE